MLGTNNRVSIRRGVAMVGVAALLACAGVARAQDGEKKMEGSFDQPLKKAHGLRGGQNSGSSSMMMSQSDGQHTYSVTVKDDVVTAEVDGKAVPKDRVERHADGQIDIKDEDGNVLKTFNPKMLSGNMGQGWLRAQPNMRVQVAPRWNVQPGVATTMQAPPKVMMGVTMTDAEDGGVSIDSVIEGLPAETAGLKAGDRIVEADGKKLAGQQELRDLIRGKEAGDTLALKIDREGKEVEAKVTLVKYDAVKLPGANAQAAVNAMGGDEMSDVREAIDKALSIVKTEKLDGEKMKERVVKQLEAAIEALDNVKHHAAAPFGGMGGDDRMLRLFGRDGQPFVLDHALAGNDDVAQELKKMSEQLEKMSKRLEKLEKK